MLKDAEGERIDLNLNLQALTGDTKLSIYIKGKQIFY